MNLASAHFRLMWAQMAIAIDHMEPVFAGQNAYVVEAGCLRIICAAWTQLGLQPGKWAVAHNGDGTQSVIQISLPSNNR